MNPWGVTRTQFRPDRAELMAWNAANQAAREEYHQNPLTICLGRRRSGGEFKPCWNVRHYGPLCRSCEDERLRVIARMWAIRRAS